MNHEVFFLKATHSIGLALILGVGISACGVGIERWKEEVQLSDGKIIVIERETLHVGGGDEIAFNRSGSKPKERHMQFIAPDGSGKMVRWQSTKRSPQRWPEKPLILDIEAREPTVFSLLAISPGCEIYSKYSVGTKIQIQRGSVGKILVAVPALHRTQSRQSGNGRRPGAISLVELPAQRIRAGRFSADAALFVPSIGEEPGIEAIGLPSTVSVRT